MAKSCFSGASQACAGFDLEAANIEGSSQDANELASNSLDLNQPSSQIGAGCGTSPDLLLVCHG
jgi:hypothetical protein